MREPDWCVMRDCQYVAVPGSVLWCLRHQNEVMEWARHRIRDEHAQAWEWHMNPPGAVVYYLRRRDGRIKIGWSKCLKQRIQALTREHGPLVLLATEPGGLGRESDRHREFDYARREGEWFEPTCPLTDHVDALNAVDVAS